MPLTNLVSAVLVAASIGTAAPAAPQTAQIRAAMPQTALLLSHNEIPATVITYVSRADYEADVEALARIMYWEARGESEQGQLAVANVVINRTRSPYWPNTIKGVISQKGQFTPYGNKKYYKVKLPQSLIDLARRALNGASAVPDDYVYFARGKARYAKDFIKIGQHYFGRRK
ncbi:MAG: cell wall hydrolase [Clostridia bacterium]|nr:cell wall hydrolase [Clostridia bacterium]